MPACFPSTKSVRRRVPMGTLHYWLFFDRSVSGLMGSALLTVPPPEPPGAEGGVSGICRLYLTRVRGASASTKARDAFAAHSGGDDALPVRVRARFGPIPEFRTQLDRSSRVRSLGRGLLRLALVRCCATKAACACAALGALSPLRAPFWPPRTRGRPAGTSPRERCSSLQAASPSRHST